MPKRSNKFQKLIAIIQRQMSAEGVEVVESAMFGDPVTGAERETDVMIKSTVAGYDVTVAVECRDHKRPQSVGWIEELITKYRDTGYKVIAVSRSGFTKNAAEKAVRSGMNTMTLQEAEVVDWNSVISNLPPIQITSFVRPWLTGVKVILNSGVPTSALDDIKLDNAFLIDSEGNTIGRLDVYARQFLGSEEIVNKLEGLAFDDDGTIFDITFCVKDGVKLLMPNGASWGVSRLQFSGKCRKETGEMPMTPAVFGIAQISQGEGKVFGRPMSMTFVQQPGSQATVIVQIKIPKKRI